MQNYLTRLPRSAGVRDDLLGTFHDTESFVTGLINVINFDVISVPIDKNFVL